MRKIAKAEARKLSEEKELLGRCDGLATAAGRESENDRVTIYNIDMQRLMRSAEPADRSLRSLEVRRAYRELSCLTQQRLAQLLRSAEDNSRPN